MSTEYSEGAEDVAANTPRQLVALYLGDQMAALLGSSADREWMWQEFAATLPADMANRALGFHQAMADARTTLEVYDYAKAGVAPISTEQLLSRHFSDQEDVERDLLTHMLAARMSAYPGRLDDRMDPAVEAEAMKRELGAPVSDGKFTREQIAKAILEGKLAYAKAHPRASR